MDLGIEGFTYEGMIGQGGFGTVYRARDENHRRSLAIKILPVQSNESMQRRFDRERQAMGTLSGHPNIGTIFTSGFTQKNEPYIVMELSNGQPDLQLGRNLLPVTNAKALPVNLDDLLAQIRIFHSFADGFARCWRHAENADRDTFITWQHRPTGKSEHRSAMKA